MCAPPQVRRSSFVPGKNDYVKSASKRYGNEEIELPAPNAAVGGGLMIGRKTQIPDEAYAGEEGADSPVR